MPAPIPGRPALVFDFGGVIFDWNPYNLFDPYFNHDRQAVEDFMAEVEFRAWNHRLDMGEPFAAVVAEQCTRFPQYAEILQAYDQRWLETFAGPIQPTVDLLARLHTARQPLYALSNWSEEKYQLVRPQFEFLTWFEQVVISGALKLAKPDPMIFKAFEQRTGLLAADCLFIDDSMKNVRGAEACGWQGHHFTSPEALRRHLTGRGLL